MAQVGADIDPDVKLERLSVANKQMVAICRAIIKRCEAFDPGRTHPPP